MAVGVVAAGYLASAGVGDEGGEAAGAARDAAGAAVLDVVGIGGGVVEGVGAGGDAAQLVIGAAGGVACGVGGGLEAACGVVGVSRFVARFPWGWGLGLVLVSCRLALSPLRQVTSCG